MRRRRSRIASVGSAQFKLRAILGEQWHQAWRCTILKSRARARTAKTNEEDEFYSAEFVPPQFYLKASELRLYGAASAAKRSNSGNGSQRVNPLPRETIDNLIVCCILVAAGRDEYKTLQSSSRPSAREARSRDRASALQSNSLTRQPLSTLSFCIEGIYVPHHLMEIQRQLYALNVAAGSAITLPPYQSV